MELNDVDFDDDVMDEKPTKTEIKKEPTAMTTIKPKQEQMEM